MDYLEQEAPRRVYFGPILKPGGPTEAGNSAFLARGLLRIRNRRLGGRAVGGTVSGRLFRVSQGDDVDVHCAQYFVNSSLAPVVLSFVGALSLSRMYSKVLGVRVLLSLGGILLVYWEAVCRHGPCGPISSLHPETSGFTPICMVSTGGFLIPLGR